MVKIVNVTLGTLTPEEKGAVAAKAWANLGLDPKTFPQNDDERREFRAAMARVERDPALFAKAVRERANRELASGDIAR